jgi:hypothetical protein
MLLCNISMTALHKRSFISWVRNIISSVYRNEDQHIMSWRRGLRRKDMDRLSNYLHITVVISTVLFTGIIFAASAVTLL